MGVSVRCRERMTRYAPLDRGGDLIVVALEGEDDAVRALTQHLTQTAALTPRFRGSVSGDVRVEHALRVHDARALREREPVGRSGVGRRERGRGQAREALGTLAACADAGRGRDGREGGAHCVVRDACWGRRG